MYHPAADKECRTRNSWEHNSYIRKSYEFVLKLETEDECLFSDQIIGKCNLWKIACKWLLRTTAIGHKFQLKLSSQVLKLELKLSQVKVMKTIFYLRNGKTVLAIAYDKNYFVDLLLITNLSQDNASIFQPCCDVESQIFTLISRTECQPVSPLLHNMQISKKRKNVQICMNTQQGLCLPILSLTSFAQLGKQPCPFQDLQSTKDYSTQRRDDSLARHLLSTR